MTSAEFDLLLAFCQHSGEVLSREQLLELTHGGLAGPVERSVDVHMSRIRQKIEPNAGDPMFIKTIRLGGYIFTPEVASHEVRCAPDPSANSRRAIDRRCHRCGADRSRFSPQRSFSI